MEKTNSTTGLNAFVHIVDKVYQTGRKVVANFKENMHIIFDNFLPHWNYRSFPLTIPIAQVI
jgi:hypothetical protein